MKVLFRNTIHQRVWYCWVTSLFINEWLSLNITPESDPFHATDLLLYPLKMWENSLLSVTSGFLMFSGGIENDQWHEMG